MVEGQKATTSLFSHTNGLREKNEPVNRASRGARLQYRGCCCTFSCHIGLICDFFGYFSAAAKLQFPYEIKCSTYLFPYLPFSSPSSSKAFEFNIRFLQNFQDIFRIPFFAHLLFYQKTILQLPTSDLAFSMFLLSIGLRPPLLCARKGQITEIYDTKVI